MRTNNLGRLTVTAVAPFLLLLCVAALSPVTTARAQARQEIDRNDESTRSIEPVRSSDSSSSSNSSSSSSSSSNDTSSNSSSSNSSNNSSVDTSSSGSDSSSSRSGGDESKRGGGGRGGDGWSKGRRNDDNNDRRLDASRKRDADDKRRDHKDGYDPWRDDTLNDNSATQGTDSQDECERGREEGRRVGASDARRGQTKDPYRSRHYRRGGGGLFSWGRSGAAKQAYRDCFLQGYEEGYQNPNLY